MPPTATSSRPFEPGTTGWTVADLEDPRIEAQWFSGRYEIVEGVLTKMPAAYFSGSASLNELIYLLKTHLRSRGLPDRFGTEVDIVLGEDRIVVADGVWLSAQDQNRQADAVRFAGEADGRRVRILVPPTLIIESLSIGHELHDRRLKSRWYAEFGVPNYWILDPIARSLQCFVLDGGNYRLDVEGRDQAEMRPALFPELIIPLGALWGE